MRHWAVYQYGHAFFGVGATCEEALTDAMEWTDGTLDEDEIADNDSARENGQMCWVFVTDALAKRIRDKGGQVRFEELKNGDYGTPEEAANE